MAMQVTCPNVACGKVLTVQEEFAGKKGKCPACGSELMIPAAPRGESGAGRPGPASRGRYGSNEPADALPAAATVRPVDDDDFAFDKRRDRSASATSKPAAGAMTRLALAVGIGALTLLALSPMMHWIYISKPDKVQSRPDVLFPDGLKVLPDGTEETLLANLYLNESVAGFDILYISLAIAALALVALMLAPTQQRDLADGAIAASGSAAVGWGVLVGIWQLGLTWKVINLAGRYTEQQRVQNIRPPTASVYPGPGLGFGLLAATVVVLVFAILVLSRKRILWVLTAGGIGFLIGLLILVLNVKPWQDIR
jgi:hypothetical protein